MGSHGLVIQFGEIPYGISRPAIHNLLNKCGSQHVIVPVPDMPFAFKPSSSTTPVKYLSKYKFVPGRQVLLGRNTVWPPLPNFIQPSSSGGNLVVVP